MQEWKNNEEINCVEFLTTVHRNMQMMQSFIGDTTEELKGKKKVYFRTLQELGKVLEEIEFMAAQCETIRTMNHNNRDLLVEMDERIINNSKKLDEWNTKRERLHGLLDKQKGELKRREDTVRDQETKLVAIESEVEQLQTKYDQGEQLLRDLLNELEQLETKLEQRHKDALDGDQADSSIRANIRQKLFEV
jgi:chromosome segregation ATPase